MNLLVRRAGFLTSVQDLGRTSWRDVGVSVGGALDRHALRVANALVGNADSAAGLELTLGTIEFRVEDARVIAWCGDGFTVQVNGESVDAGCAARVGCGDTIIFAAGGTGSRAWVAIAGGINVPAVLGSRSTDMRGGFGGLDGRALADGDVLPLGAPSVVAERIVRALQFGRVSSWRAFPHWVRRSSHPPFLRFVRGADWKRFSADTRAALANVSFTVTADADRMGARLSGPELQRADSGELVSEAVLPGTVQVPPNGDPILLLNDCQTVGGYAKIAHVITVDQNAAARLRPGDVVSFHEVALEKAHELLRKREEDFAQFQIGIALRV